MPTLTQGSAEASAGAATHGVVVPFRRASDHGGTAAPAPAPANADGPATRPAARRGKLLVVDDDPANRALLRHLIPSDEVEVIEAAGGPQALALVKQHDFALMLVDVRMPGMDGYELAAALSEGEATREIPLIFITAGDASELGSLRGYAHGAVDYIAKPVSEGVLRSKLRVFLELWDGKRQLRELLAELESRNKKLLEEIAERQRIEALVRHQAQHDALTSLPNRILFLDRLDTALDRAARHREQFALLYVDIDGFKPVNDAHGHAAGDELLRQIGQRLVRAVRRTDTVSRLGGDEFAVILEEVGSARAALQVGLKLCEAVAAPYALEVNGQGVEVRIGASIGVAVFPDHGSVSNDLVNAADAAMYRAKRGGKNHALLAEVPHAATAMAG